MAICKNYQLGKKKKKGTKKISDPFLRKEWYYVRAPNSFSKQEFGTTVATKSQGKKLARDSLMGRVFEVAHGDLGGIQAKPEDQQQGKDLDEEPFRKFKLKVEAVQGTQCLTNFYGMTLTTDKMRSLVRKWHTLIEAHVDVKTTDGYVLRLFCVGFTARRKNQHKKTSYAQSGQVRTLRRKMVEIMQREAGQSNLHELVKKLQLETIGAEVEKAANGTYPLQNVLIRKVKLLKAPKTDLSKLMELHGGASAVSDSGAPVSRPEDEAEQPAEEADAGEE
jgi:small subunit ribosomal protein S3Ae